MNRFRVVAKGLKLDGTPFELMEIIEAPSAALALQIVLGRLSDAQPADLTVEVRKAK